jgi:Dolichyl-phosphate-mannose-protein mannosyltransferase
MAHVLAVLITVLGGLLRLDALVGKYGSVDRPVWARVVTHEVADAGAALRPSSIRWRRVEQPYVGGDPVNYLKFAREMTGFYQAHVREPVFLAITRATLWALEGQDIAVSFASLAGSTLAVFATYLLGSALLSRPAGLVGALLLAVEYEAVMWSPDGWRDDTFTATVLLTAWALLRLRQQPSISNAVLAGALGGVSCLTRITALSFIVPALLWLIADGSTPPRREKGRAAGVALAVLAVVLGPYLVRCAIATGDPFIAVNYHTTYYRYAEGRPIGEPMSATEYLGAKVTDKPVASLDTSLSGLFVQPFVTKWHGLHHWLGALDPGLRWLALAGLGAFAFFALGRLLLVILLSSLVPYMLTWNVAGGGEWRFTMHAYPFYLLAVGCALAWVAGAIGRIVVSRALPERKVLLRAALRVGILVVVAAVGVAVYFGLPWFVTREAIARGEDTSIDTGERDLVFYRRGWSGVHREGITVRVSRGERSTVRIPLPGRRDYDIVLRMDPVDPETEQRVSVLFNGHLVGLLRLSWNPERVGSYRVRARAHMVRASNELTIVPSTLVTAGSAGPRFAWLGPDDRIGVRLWYVRVLGGP